MLSSRPDLFTPELPGSCRVRFVTISCAIVLANNLIEILLFDIGGVVIDIDFERTFRKWSVHSGVSVESIRARFSHDQSYERHERGEIESTEYYRQLCERIEMELSFEQFKEGWNDVLLAPIAPTVALLDKLADRVPLYAFSNSNPMHKQYWEMNFADELKHFVHIFVSSDFGFRKPEADAYRHVIEALKTNPEKIVFFDDLADNVDAARALGMQAVLVRSPADISSFVASSGLI
jgi:HAD superfamily hydrolase (TIGR01509 family)